jgi:S-adenosylmethionine hydrolase
MPDDATDDLVGEMRYARGVVIALDRYGNAVTSIKLPVLVEPSRAEVLEPERFVGSLRSSYDRVPVGAPVALVGSSGRVELAVNAGASGLLPGTEVCVRWPA